MNIILSRKGFDSSYGGCASPILPGGTMLSMPIPLDNEELKYSDISYNNKTYLDYWMELCPRSWDKETLKDRHCHLDPDIRPGIRKNVPCTGAFGQAGAAQTHLSSRVEKGDIFLFFGWFKSRDKENGMKEYFNQDLHVIFGYLQIGEIIKIMDIGRDSKYNDHKYDIYRSHPHYPRIDRSGNIELSGETNSTIYAASEKLTENGVDTGLPGYGTFDFDKRLVLTKFGCSRSKWDLSIYGRECLLHADISYHSPKNRMEDYFQSANIGQEFVIAKNEDVSKWALDLIKNAPKSGSNQ